MQRLHHVGFVVTSIAEVAVQFAESLSAAWDGRIIHDPLQMARVSFFQPATSGEPLIELVEPDGEDSPVKKFLQKGGGLHHLCFEVDSLEEQLNKCRAQRDLVVRPPTPAVAFGGRLIAWVFTKHKLLVEYLQAPKTC